MALKSRKILIFSNIASPAILNRNNFTRENFSEIEVINTKKTSTSSSLSYLSILGNILIFKYKKPYLQYTHKAHSLLQKLPICYDLQYVFNEEFN